MNPGVAVFGISSVQAGHPRRIANNTQWLAHMFCYTARRLLEIAELLVMDPEEIKTLIENGIDDADVQVFSEDNTHYAALVISARFAGKRPLARHQLVYECLGKLMGNEIHAMSIRAHTPDEWRELRAAAGE